jgi:hypothetical protein
MKNQVDVRGIPTPMMTSLISILPYKDRQKLEDGIGNAKLLYVAREFYQGEY